MTKKEMREYASDLAENISEHINEVIAEDIPEDLVPMLSDDHEENYNYFRAEFKKALIKLL